LVAGGDVTLLDVVMTVGRWW